MTDPVTLACTVQKANALGTPLIALSNDHMEALGAYRPCHLTITSHDSTIYRTFAAVSPGSHGFSPSKRLIGHLLGQPVTITVVPLPPDGWITRLGSDHRITLPWRQVQHRDWPDDTLLELTVTPATDFYHATTVYVRIFSRHRSGRLPETNAILHGPHWTPLQGQYFYVRPTRTLKPPTRPFDLNKDDIWIPDLLPEAQTGQLDDKSMIIFSGRSQPLITPILLSMDKFAHFLGCYFADGDKRSFTWGICASTIEQAQYYCQIHNDLFYNGDEIRYRITYSKLKGDLRSKEAIQDLLFSYWFNDLPMGLSKKLYIVPSQTNKPARNRNKYGTLRISGTNQAAVDSINNMITRGIDNILKNESQKVGWAFLCGVLEGDGHIGGSAQGNRAHIKISTNKQEGAILEQICNTLHLDTKLKVDKCRNGQLKYFLSIGVLSYLPYLPEISNLLFKYYPKRRNIFLERFFKQAISRIFLDINRIKSYNFRSTLLASGLIGPDMEYTSLGKEVVTVIRRLMEEQEILTLEKGD